MGISFYWKSETTEKVPRYLIKLKIIAIQTTFGVIIYWVLLIYSIKTRKKNNEEYTELIIILETLPDISVHNLHTS